MKGKLLCRPILLLCLCRGQYGVKKEFQIQKEAKVADYYGSPSTNTV